MQRNPSHQPTSAAIARERLTTFLTERLTEELAEIWARDQASLVAQVEVVDELLGVLKAGGLPDRNDLMVLLYAYRHHPDHDRQWTAIQA